MRIIGRKILRLLLIVLAASTLTFLMVDLLPGDAAFELAGQDADMSDVEAIRRELGLDRNIVARYIDWLGRVIHGDLGESQLTGEKVLDRVLARAPATIELMVLAQILALALAIPSGIFSAYKAGRAPDRLLSVTSFGAMAAPVFIASLLLIYLFAIRLRLLPASGYVPISGGLGANIKSLVLPAVSVAMVEWAPLMRVLRGDMITTLKEEYILAAQAKGLPAWYILLRHALRPSSFTLVTILGLQVGRLMGGALIVEIIFALPGLGRLLIGAVFSRDAALVQGCVLFITLGYTTVNFLVDLMYPLLDPRVRGAGQVDR